MIVAPASPFALHVRSDDAAPRGFAATFDAEGRLLSFRLGADHFRRGLDGSVARLRPQPGVYGAALEADAHAVLVRLRDAIGEDLLAASPYAAAPRVARGFETLWAEDVARFRDVLGCVPVVPPLHIRSVVLRLTEGCAYRRCRFCSLYAETPFRVRDEAAWDAHIAAVLDWFGDGAGVRPHLWIGDASVLEAGEARLLEALAAIGRHATVVPPGDPEARLQSDARAFEGLYGFADVPRAARLTAETATALAGFGVRRLYLGVESGHAPLLRALRKPHDGRAVDEAVRRLHAAGIGAGLVVLVGAGGREVEAAHLKDTATLIARAPLRAGDVVLVSPLDMESRGGPAAGDDPLDDAALAAATRELTAALVSAVPPGVRVADYGLEAFVY